MTYLDPTKLFDTIREREQTSGNGNNNGSGFGNQNLLKLQRGKSYALRLLWLPSDTREYPMINQYVHHFWNDNAVGSKDVSVICPTSQYDMDGAGFRACPICTRMSELYKQSQNGSASAAELYKKFKRTLKGYVPVYVVNGPEEDKHKIKILPYSISFKNYFDEKIFGIKKIDKNAEADPMEEEETNTIGISAFIYYDPKKDEVITEGHNLLITVGTKRVPISGKMIEMPDYKIEFSMKKTDIQDFDGNEITTDEFKSLSKNIHFDDFYKMSSEDSLNEFLRKYVDTDGDVEETATERTVNVRSNEVDEEVEAPAPKKASKEREVVSVEDVDDIVDKERVKSSPKADKPTKKIQEDEVIEEADDDSEKLAEDDIDLDDILKDIEL